MDLNRIKSFVGVVLIVLFVLLGFYLGCMYVLWVNENWNCLDIQSQNDDIIQRFSLRLHNLTN